MVVALFALAACTAEYTIEDSVGYAGPDETSDDTAVEEEDFSEFDGATLIVDSPASGDFLAYEEESTFAARVLDAEGNELDFDDIVWTSDVDDAWGLTGAEVADDSLDVGTHALTAVAALPNGDRLAYTIGGVLVQSAYTGVYTGTLNVTASGEYDGTTYSAGCGGAITLVVDAYGETATGDAGCLISLLGIELDTNYVFDLENNDGELSGVAALDLSFYQIDIEATGAIEDDGNLTLAFAEDVYGLLQLDATVEAVRVSRDISQYEE